MIPEERIAELEKELKKLRERVKTLENAAGLKGDSEQFLEELMDKRGQGPSE